MTALQAGLAWAPAVRVAAEPPGLGEFARDMALCVAAREALFYYAHRLFHVGALYRRVHKTHHRFTAPLALRAHVWTMWAFVAWQLLETATVHSGYDFFAGAARKHDRHHERFDVYFGGIGLFDWLHGTDERDDRHRRPKAAKAE